MWEQIQVTYELNIIPGKAHDLREIAKAMVALNDAEEPGTVRYNAYMNKEETVFTFLEAFSNSEHLQYHGERFAQGSFVHQIVGRTDGGRLCVLGPVSESFKDWAARAGFEIEYFDLISGFNR